MGGPFARLLLDHIALIEGGIYAPVPVGLGVSDDTNFGNAIVPEDPHCAETASCQLRRSRYHRGFAF